MMLAKALDHLGRASKSDVDFVERIRKIASDQATKAAAAAVETAAKESGVSGATIDLIKQRIFGVGTA